MTQNLPSFSKVAQFTQVGSPLELKEIPIPSLESGEMLVRVVACTICGSDLHTYTGRRLGPMPTVLGHEIIGTVVGSHAKTSGDQLLVPGTRVTWSLAASCGACGRCENDIPQKCDDLFKYGHESTDTYPLSGGLAEYCILRPGTKVIPLPADLPDDVAGPANCATATVAAAVRAAGDLKNQRVLIMGAGMLGLTATAFAKAAGASEIAVCDVDENRLQLAKEFGATSVISEARGTKFDRALEMSGNETAVENLVECLDVGSTGVLVGSVSPSRSIKLDPEQIVRRLITLRGVHNYHPMDLVTAVDFLSTHQHKFPFRNLVQRSFTLDEADEALQFAEQERPVRVSVRPESV